MEIKKQHDNLISLIIGVLQVGLVAAFPAVFLYCRNAEEANFSEIIPALLLFLCVGLFLFFCCLAITRSSGKAVVSAAILTMVMTNYSFLESFLKILFPNLKYWHIFPIILAVTLVVSRIFRKKVCRLWDE